MLISNLVLYAPLVSAQAIEWLVFYGFHNLRKNELFDQLPLLISPDWRMIESWNFDHKHILMLPNYPINFSSLEQSIPAEQLNKKSIFCQKVDFWPRFSPKTNTNFFTHLSSFKDHTLVYNLAWKSAWDAHKPRWYWSIFLQKMKFFSKFDTSWVLIWNS